MNHSTTSDSCPALLQSSRARETFTRLSDLLEAQKARFTPHTALNLIRRNLRSELLLRVPWDDLNATEELIASVDRVTVARCWPPLDVVMSKIDDRAASAVMTTPSQSPRREAQGSRQELDAGAKADAESYQLFLDTQKRRDAERAEQQRAEEAWQRGAAERAAEAAKPANVLLAAYQTYIAVKRCYESRRSYAIVYVTAAELTEAKAQVSAIEAALLGRDPSIDKSQVWETANAPDPAPADNDVARVLHLYANAGKLTVEAGDYNDTGRSYCGQARMSLKQTLGELNPASNKLQKDF